MENQDYYKVDAISNSRLSIINPSQGGSIRKYQQWLEEPDEDRELRYFERGRLLHMSILEPHLYEVENLERPSDSICTIVQKVFNEFGAKGTLPSADQIELNNRAFSEAVFAAALDVGYGQSWKSETLLNKVHEQGIEYYNFLVSASDKIVITKKDKEVIDECYLALQKNPETQKILFQEEHENEVEIYADRDGLKVKGKLDKYREDEDIVTVTDLKTTSSPISLFPYSFVKFRYYRQSAFYDYLARIKYARVHGKPPKAVRHQLIVVETRSPYETMIYDVSSDWLEYGNKEINNILQYYKKGIPQFPRIPITMSEKIRPQGSSIFTDF